MSENKPIPTFSIPADAYATFEAQAAKEGKSFSRAVRDAMRDYLAQRGIKADFEGSGREETPDKETP